MPRNVYFSQTVRSEQNLYEDLIVESLKIYGQECYYLPRGMVSRDMILNEAIESKFDDAYSIEMYLENVEGFDGDGSLFTKFGLEIREQATFVVAKRTWEKLVGIWNNGIISNRPAEGDLIYLPLSKSFMEIKFVDHQQPFYQLSKFPVYKLRCELFEYSNEAVNTGIDELDKLERQFSTEYFFDIASGNGTKFEIGEMVTQVLVQADGDVPAQEIYGKVLRLDQETPTSNIKIALGEITTNTGEFAKFRVSTGSSDKLVGETSGASWSITRVYEIDDTNANLTFVNNAQGAQNRAMEVTADTIIDFTEHNPFGDPSSV
jgi:hypothetical protein